MELEAYFDFLDPLDIRIKGHRIGIDDVLEYYLKGDTPQAIQAHYPSLDLEQIEAAITYYHRHQPQMDHYLREHAAWTARRRQELLANAPAVARRIRALVQTRHEG